MTDSVGNRATPARGEISQPAREDGDDSRSQPTSDTPPVPADRIEAQRRRSVRQASPANVPVPVPKPASIAARQRAAPTTTAALSPARFTPPTPDAAVGHGPTTPATAEVAVTVRSTTITRVTPEIAVDVARLLPNITGNVDMNVPFRSDADLGLVHVPRGTRAHGALSVENGVITGAAVETTNARGEPQPLRALGIIGVHGLQMDQRSRRLDAITGLGRFNQTDSILPGHNSVPVDPRALVAGLGLTQQIPITGPGAERTRKNATDVDNIIDLQALRGTADLSLRASSTPVSFGNGLQIAFNEGSRVRLTREPGRNVYDIRANVSSARFGTESGPNLAIGNASLHVTAEETIVDGRSHWSVHVLPDTSDGSSIKDVRLNVPVAAANGRARTDRIDLGSIRTVGNDGAPIVTVDGNRLNVNFNTRVEGISGNMHLTDARGRQAELQLGRGAQPMEIAARVDLATDIRDPSLVSSLRVTADVQGMNLAVHAPQGLQLVNGEGLSLGVGDGTALNGSGSITLERNSSGVSSFSLQSERGIQADVALHGTEVARRLGEIGVRAQVQDGAAVKANVRSFDWRTGAAELTVALKGTLDSAEVTLPTGERAVVSNATAQADAAISYHARDASPEIRGNLRVDVASTGSGTSRAIPGVEFLPESVEGFNMPGSGGVRLQLVDGKLRANLPFSVDRNGAFLTRNGDATSARLAFENISVDSRFDSESVASGRVQLPEVPMSDQLRAAERRHAAAIAAIPRDQLPAIVPPAGTMTNPRAAIDAIVNRLDAPSLIGGALNDLDLDVSMRFPSEHNFHISDGALGLMSTDVTVPKGSMRLVLESEQGRLVDQQTTRPDGTPNPTAGRPSGITFDPPLRIRFNGRRDGQSTIWESSVEVKGVDIVRSAKDPEAIEFRLRTGELRGADAHIGGFLARTLGPSLGLDEQFVSNEIMSRLTGGRTPPRTTRELAERITRNANVRIDTNANIVGRVLSQTPPEDRAFVRALFASTTIRARGSLRENVPIRVGNDHLTIRRGENISISNANGGLEVQGSIELGDTTLSTDAAHLSLAGARATLHMRQSEDSTRIELTDLSTRNLSLRSNQPGAHVTLDNASVEKGSLSIVSGERTTVAGSFEGLDVRDARFMKGDGSSYRVQDGHARRIKLPAEGGVVAEGITGNFSGNAMQEGSQVHLASARLTDGTLRMSATGAITTSPLRLTNVRGTVTNLRIPPEGSDSTMPGGISAKIQRMDVRADAATLSMTPAEGLRLRTPPGKPARVSVLADTNFEIPSPRIRVKGTSASADGLLEELQIDRAHHHELIRIRDLYVSGYASGSIVAGPEGSQAANLTIAQGSRVSVYVDRLGYEGSKGGQAVSATVVGRIDGEFALPPATSSSVQASGAVRGSIDFGIVNQDDAVRARAFARLNEGDFSADLSVAPQDVRTGVESAVRGVQDRWRSMPSRPRARRQRDLRDEQPAVEPLPTTPKIVPIPARARRRS